MSNTSIFDEDELDQAIDQIMASPDSAPAANAPEMAELLEIAAELRTLPRADFKLQLGMELQWEASGRLVSNGSRPALVASKWPGLEFIPTLFGSGKAIYPVRRANFAASLALHAAMVSLLFLGFLTVKNMPHAVEPKLVLVDSYNMPPGLGNRGGGGGQHDNTPASKGPLPRSSNQQLTPPVVILPNQPPKLPVAATIVAPDPNLPTPTQPGDPLSKALALSGGPGSNGIGSSDGGGDGIGDGNSYGPAFGNRNGFAYRPGHGVTAPRVIYSPEPEFSEEARWIKYQGTVVLWVVVGADGRPRGLRIERSLGMGLDEKALEAVRTWRFEPGTKDGHPVPVQMNIEVNFHLY